MRRLLGIALDIGTTTIQSSLIDLEKGAVLSHFSCLNGQITQGHDIISRIKFCLEKPDGLKKAHERVVSSINFAIKNLLSSAHADAGSVAATAAVGNTAIYYFTLSLPLDRVMKPPYRPEYTTLTNVNPLELGIDAGAGNEFLFLPNLGGFVGSDAIAVMLASGIDKTASPAIAIDIGTNGEIVFSSGRGIWVTSTAAGPAFEGWHMSCGMRAVEGAIESVERTSGKVKLGVIGGKEPLGIAGSGIIDAVAIMLKEGAIDRSGRLKEDFVLYEGKKRIYVSQNDVRQIQLSKAAFAVGTAFLRRRSAQNSLSRFFITGNFGRRLNRESAVALGIIPRDISPEKVEFIENGALKGAELFIKKRKETLARIGDILEKTEHISLGEESDFQKEFVEAMSF